MKVLLCLALLVAVSSAQFGIGYFGAYGGVFNQPIITTGIARHVATAPLVVPTGGLIGGILPATYSVGYGYGGVIPSYSGISRGIIPFKK